MKFGFVDDSFELDLDSDDSHHEFSPSPSPSPSPTKPPKRATQKRTHFVEARNRTRTTSGRFALALDSGSSEFDGSDEELDKDGEEGVEAALGLGSARATTSKSTTSRTKPYTNTQLKSKPQPQQKPKTLKELEDELLESLTIMRQGKTLPPLGFGGLSLGEPIPLHLQRVSTGRDRRRISAAGGATIVGGEDIWKLGNNSKKEKEKDVSPTKSFPLLSTFTSFRSPAHLTKLKPGQLIRSTEKAKSNALAKGKERERERDPERLIPDVDEWDRWEMISRQEALLKAHAQTTSQKNLLRETSQSVQSLAEKEQEEQAAREMAEVQALLRGLEVKKENDEKEKEMKFEERRKGLWDSIESSIRAAEEVAAKAQAEAQAKAQLERQKAAELEAARKRLEEEARLRKEKQAAEAKAAAEALVKEKERQAKLKAELQAEREEEERARIRGEASRGVLVGTSTKRAEWLGWVEKQREIKLGVVEKLKGDKEGMSKIRLSKRKLTAKVGQVINTSRSVKDVTEAIHAELCACYRDGATPQDITITKPVTSSSTVPIQYTYLLSHLSKALIKQAESEVNAKPEAAYPLAKVALAIMLRGHTMFGMVFMARLVKKCPWVVPYYPDRLENQSPAEFRKSLGFKPEDDPETSIQYTARMSGTLTLYLAMCCTRYLPIFITLPSPPKDTQTLESCIPESFRMPACWSWMAGMLRRPTSAQDASANLLCTGLETMGAEVLQVYGQKQIVKVLQATLSGALGLTGRRYQDDQGHTREEVVDAHMPAGPGAERLKLFVQGVLEKGAFPEIKEKVFDQPTD